jgi:lysophospholipase L1-like esterase
MGAKMILILKYNTIFEFHRPVTTGLLYFSPFIHLIRIHIKYQIMQINMFCFNFHSFLKYFLIFCLSCFLTTAGKSQNNSTYKFDFGTGNPQKGFTKVTPGTNYSKKRGYGIVSKSRLLSVSNKGKDVLKSDFLTSSAPFYFEVDLPEGNYKVAVHLGDSQGESKTTVRAESRRLMLREVKTQSGEVVTHSFIVNVRSPNINSEEKIRRKPRELKYLNWDDKLSLEFNNSRPCVAGVEIEKIEHIPTVFLAGNSTVVDQEYEPWAAWGQMLPAFFKPEIAVANYAESGESLKSFIGEKRLQKIISVIGPGDYLFIEFAHNDQKPGASYVAPFTTYKEHLKLFIEAARKKGAHPVLVTSMHRRKFDEQGNIVNTLDDYPEAVRQTGKEENVPVIDLNSMSKILYEAWGPEKSKKAFVHFPENSFPGQRKALEDNTHFSTYGAYELAKCVVEGIKQNKLPLARLLKADIETFDPAFPDPVESWFLPLAPDTSLLQPDGN